MLCDAAAAWFVNAAAPIVLRDVWVWFMHPYERQEVSYVSRYFEVIFVLKCIGNFRGFTGRVTRTW
jgi:hypothetical protein